jgi:hypothetical protein
VYQGQTWDLLTNLEDLDLRNDSRIYLVYADNVPWPRGPCQQYQWSWEGQEPHYVMGQLGKLLADHASPFDRCMEGLYLAASQLRVEEEEWKGE